MKVKELINCLDSLTEEEKEFDIKITSLGRAICWDIKPIEIGSDYDDGLDVDYEERIADLFIDDWDLKEKEC